MKKKILILVVLLQILSICVFPQLRGLAVKAKDANGREKEIKLYQGSYALIIGNSDYTNGWQSLSGVKSDIVAVKSTLEKQLFKVEVAENLSNRQFADRVKQFIDDYGFEPNNRLLIYFAGHGYTMKSAGDNRDLGFIVPVDAPDPFKDEIGFRRRAISMEYILTIAKEIQSKHALFIFDSCFSGQLIMSRDKEPIPPFIEEKVAYPVRQFITAGDATQKVPDESIFRRAFVRGLDGEADRNQDGFISGSELADYLSEKVTNYSNRRQTPQYGKINDINLDRGDFIFSLRDTISNLSQTAVVSNTEINTKVEAQSLAEKALAQFANGNSEEAQKLATQSLSLENQNVLALTVRGRILMSNGKENEAQVDLDKAVRIAPSNGLATAFLGILYSNQGNSEARKSEMSKQTAQRAIQLLAKPTGMIEYYARGVAYNLIDEQDKAIFDLNKAIELNPNFATAYNNRGISYSDKKEYDLAIRDFTKAIELNPKYSFAYTNRGKSFNSKKEYDLAIRDFTKAIELNPTDILAYNNRGNSYNSKKEYDLAIRDYTKAIELNPLYVYGYSGRGLAYNNKKEYDLAIRDLTKAIELNPNFAFAYYSRGKSYNSKREFDLAIRDYTKAIELNSLYVDAYINRGNSYLNKKEYDLAIRDYTKVIELNPNYAGGYNNRAIAYDQIGEITKAEADRRKARELGGN